jgi:hypothetical protein
MRLKVDPSGPVVVDCATIMEVEAEPLVPFESVALTLTVYVPFVVYL